MTEVRFSKISRLLTVHNRRYKKLAAETPEVTSSVSVTER